MGPNAVTTHRVSAVAVLLRQLRSALLALLAIAATVSFFVGERTDAIVIGAIPAVSVGLGFGNEYRAERAGAALHDQLRHQAVVVRGGDARSVDVVGLVPGDVVRLVPGTVVPADVRLIDDEHLQCSESVLTGESAPVTKDPAPVLVKTSLADLTSCALMGTVVSAGSATGAVVATGRHGLRQRRHRAGHAHAGYRVPGRSTPVIPPAGLGGRGRRRAYPASPCSRRYSALSWTGPDWSMVVHG